MLPYLEFFECPFDCFQSVLNAFYISATSTTMTATDDRL